MLKTYYVYNDEDQAFPLFEGHLNELKEWVEEQKDDVDEVIEELDEFVGSVVKFEYTDRHGDTSNKLVKVDNIDAERMLLQGWDLTVKHEIDKTSYRNYKIKSIKELEHIEV